MGLRRTVHSQVSVTTCSPCKQTEGSTQHTQPSQHTDMLWENQSSLLMRWKWEIFILWETFRLEHATSMPVSFCAERIWNKSHRPKVCLIELDSDYSWCSPLPWLSNLSYAQPQRQKSQILDLGKVVVMWPYRKGEEEGRETNQAECA